MQIQSLRLRNFRQHAATELQLGPGLLAVVGPNGSGKTTLLEAIAWALYGASAARGTRDTIRRRGADPRAKVEVEVAFSLGDHEYRLLRTVTRAELTQDGQVIANSTLAVTERVNSLLGMSREEFFNTYFTGQKELAVMATMTPAERGRFLARVLGHEKLREAQEQLRARRATCRAELAGLEQGLADPEELDAAVAAAREEVESARNERELAEARATASKNASEELQPEWRSARERQATWQGLDGERKVAIGRVEAARSALEAIDRQLAEAIESGRRASELASAIEPWAALEAERDALDVAAAAVTERSKLVARRDSSLERRQVVVAELAQLPTAEDVNQLIAAVAEAKSTHDSILERRSERSTRYTQDKSDAEQELRSLEDQFTALRKQYKSIEQAGPDGVCPFCTRPLGSEHAHTLQLLHGQMEDIGASGKYYRQRVKQLSATPQDLLELDAQLAVADAALQQSRADLTTAQERLARRSTLVAELATLDRLVEESGASLAGPAASYDSERHAVVRQRLKELEPTRREHDKLRAMAERAARLVTEAATAEEHSSAVEGSLAELDKRIATLDWHPDRFAELESKVEQARLAAEAARLELAQVGSRLESALKLQEMANRRRTDRAEKAATARKLNSVVERLTELDGAFGDLRTLLNQRLRPDLAERAGEFLRDLTDGRYTDLELSEDYVATIVEDGETKPVISGGEEDVVNLALRLAISQLIAERAGQPLSLLVLDEVFASLDESRRLAVVELLRAISDRFPQVLVITHVEGLRDAFDRVVTVSFDRESGVSVLREDDEVLVDALG